MKSLKIILKLLVITSFVIANEPNNVKTSIFSVGTSPDTSGIEISKDLITTTYSDGMGRKIQNKIILSDNKERVVSTFYDAAGKIEYTTKPYIDTLFYNQFVVHSLSQLSSSGGLLQKDYAGFDGSDSGDDPVAYNRIKYYSDPLGKEYEIGSEGEAYTVDSHSVKIWRFGSNNSFLNKTELNNNSSYFDALYISKLSPDSNYSNLLTLTMDPNGNFKQELYDIYGRLIKIRIDPDISDTGTDDVIISEILYDALDRVIVEKAPKNGTNLLIDSTEFIYNALGQIIKKITADGCTINYEYNKSGNIIKTKYYYNSVKVREIENTYDDFQRVITISKPDSLLVRNDTIVVKNVYDRIDELVDQEKYGIPQEYLNKLQNLIGRLVAAISVNQVENSTYYVVDLYSYDDEGRIIEKFKIIPGFPVQQLSYDYDLQGKKTKETFVCGTARTVKKYIYNELGILKRIVNPDDGNKNLVEYQYNDLGQLKNKKISVNGGLVSSYDYNIREWMTNISTLSNLGFEEELNYNNLYNGNIKQINYKYKDGSITEKHSQAFTYDGVNRLTSVSSFDSVYNSVYSYDQLGRFKTKIEGPSNNDDYIYYGMSNRLCKSKRIGEPYLYDSHGNMVVDKNKKMVVKYDWRDLPICFRFYNEIPVSSMKIYNDSRGTYIINDTLCSGWDIYKYIDKCVNDSTIKLISSVNMLYDAVGNRVMKIAGNN